MSAQIVEKSKESQMMMTCYFSLFQKKCESQILHSKSDLIRDLNRVVFRFLWVGFGGRFLMKVCNFVSDSKAIYLNMYGCICLSLFFIKDKADVREIIIKYFSHNCTKIWISFRSFRVDFRLNYAKFGWGFVSATLLKKKKLIASDRIFEFRLGVI